MLDVDLGYPSEVHELHNNYPLGPEKFKISLNMLSNCCFSISNEYGITTGGVNALVPNLDNRSKYSVVFVIRNKID